MIDYQFMNNFEVRVYECDLQGIFNNAVYHHYLEHTRHAFLKQKGIDFTALVEKGINLVFHPAWFIKHIVWETEHIKECQGAD
jgi:acyl-CoA thioester hydrolase